MEVIISRFFTFLKKVIHADIVRVFSFTALSTLVRMLTGFVSVKVVAVIVGPAGIALLGQLNNFSAMIMNFACGGINSGVTKYLAEYRTSEKKVKSLLSTALKITVLCSSVCAAGMFVFRNWLSRTLLFSDEYAYVFLIFGFTIILYAFNMLIASVLNGYMEFKKYVSVNIAGSLFGLLFTLTFVYFGKLAGALVSAVTFQSVMFFVSLWMVRKMPWVNRDYFKAKFDRETAKKYFRYSLMTLVALSLGPLSQLFLRSYVITNISEVEAGWWEAMNRISGMYLSVITGAFGVYYLPRLSELKSKSELRHEVFKAYKVIIPVLITGCLFIYFIRVFLIRLLFTPDFIPMEQLFKWQLCGDLFKIASWLLAYLMVAKSMTKIYITTEILFFASYVVLGLVLVRYQGIIGMTLAYFINYIFYLGTMLIVFRKLLFLKTK